MKWKKSHLTMLSQKKFCVLFVDNMFLNQSANMIMQY